MLSYLPPAPEDSANMLYKTPFLFQIKVFDRNNKEDLVTSFYRNN